MAEPEQMAEAHQAQLESLWETERGLDLGWERGCFDDLGVDHRVLGTVPANNTASSCEDILTPVRRGAKGQRNEKASRYRSGRQRRGEDAA